MGSTASPITKFIFFLYTMLILPSFSSSDLSPLSILRHPASSCVSYPLYAQYGALHRSLINLELEFLIFSQRAFLRTEGWTGRSTYVSKGTPCTAVRRIEYLYNRGGLKPNTRPTCNCAFAKTSTFLSK